MSRSRYNTAQICLNGHVINDSYNRKSDNNREHCEKCGARTIIKCPNCNEDIRGAKYSLSYIGASPYAGKIFSGDPYVKSGKYERPAFCSNCGNPYPWTEKKIKAACELAHELDSLNSEEKELLEKSIDDIIKETPETKLAVTRIKKLLPKVGKEAGNIFKDLIADIASESVKKMLWG